MSQKETQPMNFTVYGVPQPQGSSKAFIPKGWNRAIITSANAKNKPWRQQVSAMALDAMNGSVIVPRGLPVVVRCDFYFDRPKSAKKAAAKTTKPDADKLARSILDALSGIAFEDDSQVTELHVTKDFGSPARADITVYKL